MSVVGQYRTAGAAGVPWGRGDPGTRLPLGPGHDLRRVHEAQRDRRAIA